MCSKIQAIGNDTSATTTRPNDTTAYAVGDVVGESPAANLVFDNVLGVDGANFIIKGASLRVDVNAVPSGMGAFRLHLFNAAPTAIADNSAFNLIAADRSKYLGWIDFTVPVDIGDTLFVSTDSLNIKRRLASSSVRLYGVLETRAVYTPSAQASKTVKLYVSGV